MDVLIAIGVAFVFIFVLTFFTQAGKVNKSYDETNYCDGCGSKKYCKERYKDGRETFFPS